MNNAATAFKDADPTPFRQQAEPTLKINFFKTIELTEALLPLLRYVCYWVPGYVWEDDLIHWLFDVIVCFAERLRRRESLTWRASRGT